MWFPVVFLIFTFSVIDGQFTQKCGEEEDVPDYLCINGTTCTDGCNLKDLRGPRRSIAGPEESPSSSAPLTRPNIPPSNINNSISCGNRKPKGLGFIIEDTQNTQTQFGEFPWMVSVLERTKLEEVEVNLYVCGASLIHPQVVLTSAQCVDKPRRLRIRAGEWDVSTKSEIYEHQDREVIDTIIHPDYNNHGIFNDVALLILDSPLELMENIETVCLPSQDEVLENSICIATGWGKNGFDKSNKYQMILKKVELPIVQRDACQEQLRNTSVGKHFILDKSFICAGGELGKDTCTGDGGGPLVCPIPGKEGKYHQRGLVSWGIGCGNEVPGIYGNVAGFRNWIDNEMLKLKLDTSTYTA